MQSDIDDLFVGITINIEFMTIIVCVDDNNGILFNKRRQSRDKAVIADIINSVEDNAVISVTPYSSLLFEEYQSRIKICESFDDDSSICFVEDADISHLEERIDQIILYKWNRVYPASVYFDIELDSWKCISSGEFCGNSHDTITKEIYLR